MNRSPIIKINKTIYFFINIKYKLISKVYNSFCCNRASRFVIILSLQISYLSVERGFGGRLGATPT